MGNPVADAISVKEANDGANSGIEAKGFQIDPADAQTYRAYPDFGTRAGFTPVDQMSEQMMIKYLGRNHETQPEGKNIEGGQAEKTYWDLMREHKDVKELLQSGRLQELSKSQQEQFWGFAKNCGLLVGIDQYIIQQAKGNGITELEQRSNERK